MKEASYYEKLDNGSVRCLLCPHRCTLRQDDTGVCRVRSNIGGRLYSMNYACVASIAVDPVEKKPLYHFYPGSLILSAGTLGCNFKCSWCQNWTIAHGDDRGTARKVGQTIVHDEDQIRVFGGARTMEMTPEALADLAEEYANGGSIGVAYTYNEPSIWYEFVLDTARLVKEKGLANVLVTNGFINKEPLEELLPYIDAMNIDVKAFSDDFYKRYCKGGLDHVRQTVERAAQSCHVEITTLVIPGLNDSPEEIGELAKWLASIDRDMVLHLTRFFPSYNMGDIGPTPRKTLESARESAHEYLRHVYLGNI